ncbi:MAG: hypothetical protein MUD05_00790 [Candidatus Nanopelagicales bacterium]|jgi:hypothetical protein|nr:hypothetical protein [Candidatus Nanopelagicales bacterium]
MTAPLHPVGVIARYLVLGAALGVPVGVLWVWWAPRVQVTSLEGPAFVEGYPQGFAVSDLMLGALMLGAGVAIGVVASVRLRRTGFVGGWSHVVGAIAGAATCAAVARVTGWWLAGRDVRELADGILELPVTVGANGVLLLGVFSALLVIVMYAAFARDPVMPGSEQSAHSSP